MANKRFKKWFGKKTVKPATAEKTNTGKEPEKENRSNTLRVYNVVILDRSGSMQSLKTAAVTGFNETLAGIQKAQIDYAKTQQHFVTLVTFCGCQVKQVFDKVPADKAAPLQMKDYQPCCMTPLYDAMGTTLTCMRSYLQDKEDYTVMVTIITDGMENASKEFSGKAVKALVDDLREEGWTFTYMGANQDAVEVASNLSIHNAVNFEASIVGTQAVMRQEARMRMNYFGQLNDCIEACDCQEAMPEGKQKINFEELADKSFKSTFN